MDTTVEYSIIAPNKKLANEAMVKAHQEIERIEHLFGEQDTSSEIFRFNQSTSGIQTCTEVYHRVYQALEYKEITNGAFDITIKPVLDLYPFLFENPVPPEEKNIRKSLINVGKQFIKTSYRVEDSKWILEKSIEKAGLTVGGFVKGYAVDKAIAVLKDNQIKNALINAGGDIYCLGRKNGKPWKIGIQHPRSNGKLLNILRLSNVAVATSGDYQRYFLFEGKRYHHILNPSTGYPARKAQSTTVIAPTSEEADIWATALFILGPKEGIELIDNQTNIYGCIIDSSGFNHYSEGFSLFLAEK